MKKLFTFLFFFTLLLSVQTSSAQCNIDTSLSKPGFKPDTIPHAMENVYYSQVIQFKFPTDTTILTQHVVFDSLTIKSIDSLPKSISWQCGDTDRTYLGGANGCLTLFGTPPIGSAGKYKMLITVTAHFPLPAPFPYRHQDFTNSWNFYVDGNSFVAEPEFTNHITASPNPFDQQVTLTLPQNDKNYIQIFDVQGKEVYINGAGSNPTITIDTKQWNGGIYIIKNNGLFAGKIVKM